LDSKDYLHLEMLAEKLAGLGFTVVRFDPTGTWESDGDIEDYTTSQYLQDIQSVLEYMLADGEYTYILLGGHSRGGQVSFLYAAHDTRISCVLGIMPSTGSMVGKKRDEWEYSGIHVSKRDLPDDPQKTREFLVPFSHVLDRDKYSALEAVREINIPIICVAGGEDVIVPAQQVRELYNNAHDPKIYIFLQEIGHDYRSFSDQISSVNGKIVEVLNTLKKE